MKKTPLLILGFLVSFTTSALAFAGPVISGGGAGDRNQYLSCSNDELHFVIRGTAVPTFKQGLLVSAEDSENAHKFKCNLLNTPLVEGQPSAGTLVWSCEEYPTHEGNYALQVETSGLTGMTSAYLVQKQAFPLDPKALATLNCR